MEERREMLLSITEDEMHALVHFINYNDWDVSSIIVKNDWKTQEFSQSEPMSAESTNSDSISPSATKVEIQKVLDHVIS